MKRADFINLIKTLLEKKYNFARLITDETVELTFGFPHYDVTYKIDRKFFEKNIKEVSKL